jgi:tol-pal system protein YbgF
VGVPAEAEALARRDHRIQLLGLGHARGIAPLRPAPTGRLATDPAPKSGPAPGRPVPSRAVAAPLRLCLTVLALAACGTPAPEASEAPAETGGGEATEVAPAEDRVRELEARLAVVQGERRRLEERVATLEREAGSRVRVIRRGTCDEPTSDVTVLSDEAPSSDGARPVLRLVGEPTAPRPATVTDGVRAIAGPPPPAVAPPPPPPGPRLPVAAGGDAPVAAIPVAPVPVLGDPPSRSAPSRVDAGAVAYRAALATLTSRRFAAAAAAFERFLADHPGHPYADDALYWLGEARYGGREYATAAEAFETLLRRHPRAPRLPDALLRLGRSYERLGRSTQARRAYQLLRRRFPESVAARTAPDLEDV